MPGQPSALTLTVDSLRPADVPALVERVARREPARAQSAVVCDLRDLSDADLRTVDALARLALGVRRLGLAVRLSDPPPELRELLDLAGLHDVVPCVPRSGVEVVREPEHREEARGVEEEGDPGDLPVT